MEQLTISSDCKAAVFHLPGEPLTIESFSLPKLKAGEAIVRIRCATICGSDLHTFFGRRQSPTPSILGHEMVGDISELHHTRCATDFHGKLLSIGDRVTWSMLWSCGTCFYCERGLVSKCDQLMKFGHEVTGRGHDLLGGYAEYCHLPAGTAIFKVPSNLPDSVAAPSNCATSTVAAVLRHAGNLDGLRVVVLGAGMLGLTACAMARSAGAQEIIAIEPHTPRRGMAIRFGASHTIDSNKGADAARQSVLDVTRGRGADVVLEFAGTAAACESALPLLRAGGHLVVAGAVFPSRPASIAMEQVVRRMLRITGVYNYIPQDLQHALNFLSENQSRFPFEDLIGGTFPLGDINRAVLFAETAKPPRVAVVPI